MEEMSFLLCGFHLYCDAHLFYLMLLCEERWTEGFDWTSATQYMFLLLFDYSILLFAFSTFIYFFVNIYSGTGILLLLPTCRGGGVCVVSETKDRLMFHMYTGHRRGVMDQVPLRQEGKFWRSHVWLAGFPTPGIRSAHLPPWVILFVSWNSALVPATRLPASLALIPPGLEFLDNSVHLFNLFDMSHCFVKRADSKRAHTSTLLYNKWLVTS